MITPDPRIGLQSRFLSCEWGTPMLRVCLVESPALDVRAAVESSDGIAPVYARWSEFEGKRPSRGTFYRSYLRERIAALENTIDGKLAGVPMVVSGMASSSIGMGGHPLQKNPFRR
ncbi:MAG: hypothetical protein ABIZ81_16715 [Opitutaceae bacterium]